MTWKSLYCIFTSDLGNKMRASLVVGDFCPPDTVHTSATGVAGSEVFLTSEKMLFICLCDKLPVSSPLQVSLDSLMRT